MIAHGLGGLRTWRRSTTPDDAMTLQHLGLVAASRVLSPDGWETASAAFVGDLHVAPHDLLKPDKLAAAYASTLEPQLAIARAIGFEADWKFAE